MSQSFFITTAIDYTNGAPHIGHAYEKVLADVLARFHWLKGDQVFFLTGVDQHGQKVQQSAEKQGIAPQQFVDGITAKFIALWDKLEVHYENHGGWAATTAPKHKDCVRAILQRLWDDKGADGQSRWIYKKSQRGYYSVRQEQFLTDKERGPDGEFGPEWGQVEERDEENYYFRLTKGGSLEFDPKQWLLDLIDRRTAERRPFVIPHFRVTELRNAVEKLEGDLCISRPKARLSWGIPFPFDEDFVTYVWFDALVNYISFAPHYDPAPARPPEDFLHWWKYQEGVSAGVTHVIGKDILIPAHGVYWPIMLKALGFADDEMPTLLVHGWWNIAGAKMSKSLGNSVDPDALADKYGSETLRYYLMSDITTGRDADFSEERLVQRYNTDLANSLGNLLNRSLSMAQRYREGKIAKTNFTNDLLERVRKSFEPVLINYYKHSFTGPVFGAVYEVSTAVEFVRGTRKNDASDEESDTSSEGEIFATFDGLGVTHCNRFIDKVAPWKLAKDPTEAAHLDAVLYTLAESLRIIAILMYPVLPRASHGIFDQLNWKMADSGRAQRFHLDDAKWGGLPDGHVLGKPTPLFPRLEAPASAE